MLKLPKSVRDLNRTHFFSVMALTAIRIPLALVFAALYHYSDSTFVRVWIGACLLGLIEISDGLDGYLARRFKVVSESI